MKKILSFLVLASVLMNTNSAHSQTKKSKTKSTTIVTPSTTPANSNASPAMKYSSKQEVSIDSFDSKNEVTAKFGMLASAIHLGVDYNKMTDGAGFGGYFFMQTDKKSNGVVIVNQVLSFGANYKMNLVDSSQILVYASPGFGIHMVKEIGSASASGTQSDETAIGPALGLGFQYKLNPNFALGLERKAIVNWLNDKARFAEGAYYSAAGTFWF